MTDLWQALAQRFRPELMWTVGDWEAERIPDGLRLTSPNWVYVYRVPGVDLAGLGSEVPQDRNDGSETSEIPAMQNPSMINSESSVPAFNGPELGEEDEPSGAHSSGSSSSPAEPPEPEPPRRRRRGLPRRSAGLDDERGWVEAPLPGRLRQW